jgi:molybdopterin synthase catalytic subunit
MAVGGWGKIEAMKVSLLLFAGLRELVGQRELAFELDDGATVDELKQRLGDAYPAARGALGSTVCAIDDEYVAFDERLRDGAKVALIPPVSGGAIELYRITEQPLDAQMLAGLVRSDDCGAVTLFYGVVRNHSEGRGVERMEYEAHASMALKKLREVGEEAKSRFPIREIGVWHRVGLLELGEASLLVAVASEHRKEAFEACHWAVDRVKEVVPVWKKEHFRDGAAWVEGHPVETPGLSSIPLSG